MMSDKAQIAAGIFYTDAELRANPRLRSQAQAAAPVRRDPNSAPPTRAAVEAIASGGVCGYCYQPGDQRSALVDLGHGSMHPECEAVWVGELAGR
jgi:hypothetical protein